MIEQITFHSAAAFELREAYEWYEDRETDLGTAFVKSIEVCIQTIRSQPEIYPIVHKKVRQGLLRRFPYSVLYLVSQNSVIVIAVFHSSRDPQHWKQRT